MIDAITEPFSQGLAQRALVELLLLGAVCGPLGCWVVLYRQSYLAESLSHGLLPGLVLSGLAGLPLALGALGGAAAVAGGVAAAGRDERLGPDAGVAVTVTALFGAGGLLALLPSAPRRLEELLFGDLLGVGTTDLIVTGALAAIVLCALGAMHRSLTAVAFDPTTAPALGARVAGAELILLMLVALTVVAAVGALGSLLAVALLVAPAAAARRCARRLSVMMAVAAAMATGAGIAGLYLSHYLELAAGASVALMAVALFVLTLPAASRLPSGLLSGPRP